MATVERPSQAWQHIASGRRDRRRLIGAAIAAGIVFRLAFGLLYWTDKPLTLDEQEYLLLARHLVAGQGYTYGADAAIGLHFQRPPFYPLFVGAVLWIAGDTVPPEGGEHGVSRALKVAQSLLGGVAIALIALVAARVAGRPAAVVAAWLAALHPPLIWICAYAMSEALYVVLALLVVWLLGRVTDRAAGRGLSSALAAGVAAGLAVLTREAMVFFLIPAAVWLVWTRRFSLVIALVLGAAAAILPWTARNYLVYGRFVLGAPHGGVTFWTGNNPLAGGEGDLAANPILKQARIAFEEGHRGLTSEELDSAYYREAISYLTGQPLAWIGLEARKLFYTIVPIGPSYRLHSNRYYIASLVSYLGLLPFAVLGVVALVRRGHPPWALWLMAASAVMVSLVFFPQERFRIPVIDPTLVVCAASWWALAGDPRSRWERA